MAVFELFRSDCITVYLMKRRAEKWFQGLIAEIKKIYIMVIIPLTRKTSILFLSYIFVDSNSHTGFWSEVHCPTTRRAKPVSFFCSTFFSEGRGGTLSVIVNVLCVPRTLTIIYPI